MPVSPAWMRVPFSCWKSQQKNAVKPRVSSWRSRSLSKVLDAVVQRVDGAVHHRGARAEAHVVRDAHDVEPLVARALRLGDLAAHAIDEDLGAAAGHRVEPRRVQPLEHRRDRRGSRAATMCKISSGESAWRPSLYSVFIQRKRSSYQAMRRSGLSPPCRRICTPPASTTSCSFLPELLALEHVALGVADGPIERAEAAARRADVRVVDVAIDDVRDDALGVLAARTASAASAEVEERRLSRRGASPSAPERRSPSAARRAGCRAWARRPASRGSSKKRTVAAAGARRAAAFAKKRSSPRRSSSPRS